MRKTRLQQKGRNLGINGRGASEQRVEPSLYRMNGQGTRSELQLLTKAVCLHILLLLTDGLISRKAEVS